METELEKKMESLRKTLELGYADTDKCDNPECVLHIPFLFDGEKPMERFTIDKYIHIPVASGEILYRTNNRKVSVYVENRFSWQPWDAT